MKLPTNIHHARGENWKVARCYQSAFKAISTLFLKHRQRPAFLVTLSHTPIFTIISLLRFQRKFSMDRDFHHTLAVLLHYLAKSENPIYSFLKTIPISSHIFYSALFVAAEQSESEPRRLRGVGILQERVYKHHRSRTQKSCASMSRRTGTIWTWKWLTTRSVNGASNWQPALQPV